MYTQEHIYLLSLTRVPDLGNILSRLLLEHFGSATAIFNARLKELAVVDGIGEYRAGQIKKFKDHHGSETELTAIADKKIQLLFITDEGYPKRLRNCADAPLLLFYRGRANLNHARTISIIGTRHHTEYGRWATEQLIRDLLPYQVMIISGLAYGIDAIAHKTALQQQIPTIGVLAHGFQTIYPRLHRSLAQEMIEQGGLLTEFLYHELPDRHHFPQRNRIVAGMADATIIIETAIKGGSMITADLAFQYNRDVFALPGRINDFRSTGCLQLITDNKATAFINTTQFLETMGWLEIKKKKTTEKKLFYDLTTNEQIILSLLQEHDSMHIDEIYLKSRLSSSELAAAILNLELQNIIIPLPGKYYRVS
jgi:DNA processing protein